MSFQTGGATDPINLLAQFKVFLVAAGWTADQDFVQGTGRLNSLSKGNKHISLRSFINEAGAQYGQSGGSTASGIATIAHAAIWADPGDGRWWNQGGVPTLAGQTPFAGAMTAIMFTPSGVITNYWMFADATGDNVVLVAFKTAGVYTYLYFGDIIKVQAWNGNGVYFGASSPMPGSVLDADGTSVMPAPPAAIASNKAVGFLRCDVDSFAGKWTSLTHTSGATSILSTGKAMQATAHRVGASDQQFDNIGYWSLRTNAASSRTGALIMLPILWLVERDFGGALSGGGYSLVGTIPNIFQAQTAGFVPGAAFSISTDPYIVFPGFAIRKFP
jgi:hypothetical protein